MDCRRADSETRRGIAMGLILAREKACDPHRTSKASKTRSARWTSRSRARSTGSPAIQMDIKVDGITNRHHARSADAGQEARLIIIGKLKGNDSGGPHRDEPVRTRMIVVTISPDKIKDVIGPGGQGDQQDHRRHRSKIEHRERRHVYIRARRRSRGEAKAMVRSVDQVRSSRRNHLGTVTRHDELRCVRRDSAG